MNNQPENFHRKKRIVTFPYGTRGDVELFVVGNKI